MAAVLDDDGHLALAAHADLAALMQDLFRDHLASDASPLAPDAALEQVWTFPHTRARPGIHVSDHYSRHICSHQTAPPQHIPRHSARCNWRAANT